MLPWQRKSVAPAVPAFLSGQLLVFGYQGWVVLLASLLLLHAVCYILAVKCRGTMLDPLSRDPMLAAHFLPQLLAFVLSAYCGAGDWMFHMSSESGEDIGAYLPQGERIACIMIGFQLYELMSCYFSKRLRGAANELIVHHIVAILLAALVYYYQAFQYQGPAFMGMAEISSLPLAIVDLFKQFPELRKHFPMTNELARNLFAVSFLVLRGAYWPLCSYRFCMITAAVLSSGAPIAFPMWAVYIFVGGNVLMTFLQWYWASIILKAIYFLAIGDERHKDS